MGNEQQSGEVAVKIHLWLNNDNGVHFEVGFRDELIDRGKTEDLSVFEEIVVQRILGFTNDLETINIIFGYK